ncbi:MAG: SMC-Scp complex subunit ScpB [Actinomycetia bacterium]|nr:SMC-Scp complex subunit ScpB [Actinomycetes bacterium]MCP4963097.1 SMC-Scp complex subunit ScpB [Actinomycetes bacterium]
MSQIDPTPESHDRPVTTETRAALEAVLIAADQPVDPNLLAQLLEIATVSVEQLCRDLAAEYRRQGRGFTIAKVAGGYRYQTAADQAAYVERFVLEGQSARLSAAAMETLAIVAYKQPMSRAQISAIRGVNVDGVLRSLETRGYVGEVGRDPGPGQAVLYGTTDVFLEKLGLDSTDDLPPLGGFVPEGSIVEALERGLRTPDEQRAAREAVTKGLEVES